MFILVLRLGLAVPSVPVAVFNLVGRAVTAAKIASSLAIIQSRVGVAVGAVVVEACYPSAAAGDAG